jgi:phospholipid/cholesterol/gamma-HCH transport system permease protein
VNILIACLRQTGEYILDLIQRLGRLGVFLFLLLARKPRFLRVFPLFLHQLYFLGVLSVTIIAVSALFIGMVVGLQGYNTLTKFGATAQLGQLIALSIVRELGPVVTALLFAGRAGSALTGEIGLMKSTQQLGSMEMMGVDPLWRVLYPRFWGGFIALPILTAIFDAVALLGGYAVGVLWLGVDGGTFWGATQASVSFSADVINGLIKSVIFGLIVSGIAVYQGYTAEPTAEGVGKAATRTVIYASLAVLGLDFVLTSIMSGGG